MPRMTKPGRPKFQCENCPSRNRRVRFYDLRKKGELVRRMLLCEACYQVAERLIRDEAA